MLTPEQNHASYYEDRQMKCEQHAAETELAVANPVTACIDHVVVGKKTDDGDYQ